MKKIFFVLLVLVSSTLFASEEADKLRTVMNDPDASLFAKTLACKQAAQNGTKDSAEVLAPFLADEMLSHPARIALERIPDPVAGTVLCEAIPKVQGKLLIGVLQSLGERREAASVTVIAPVLDNPETAVARAAAVALGKIGTPDALAALQAAWKKAPNGDRKALYIDGLFGCAEALAKAGKPSDAEAVYTSIRTQADVPAVLRGGAVRGEIFNAGDAAPKKLETLLADPDDVIFTAALETVRNVKADRTTQSLLAVLQKLAVDRQTLLISAIGDRADDAARPLLSDWAKNGKTPVKQAAIRALYGVPDDAVIGLLLDLLNDADSESVNAAISALHAMKSPTIDQQVVKRLSEAKGKQIMPLADVCRLRRIGAATPVLLPSLKDPDIEVRRKVLAALGYTVSGEDVSVLVDRLMKPDSKIEFDTVLGSIHTVCARTVDQDAVAALLGKAYETAPLDTQVQLLHLLRSLGGKVAIETVRKAAATPNEKIQDVATEVLGNWPDTEAAPVLLDYVKNSGDTKFQIRALRGYIRIIRQMDTSNQHRYKMTLDALAIAKRDEEKLLLIDALGRLPLPEAITKAKEMIDTPQFTEAVCTAMVNSAKPIITQHRDFVVQAMQLVGEKSKNENTLRIAKEIIADAG